jgi:cytoskeleton protein RodZ
MFEIGPSLREARMRRGLSPGDVQKAIRIRDRYLSAIEDERWELLPGAAYAKGFLRTYADFLGLNGSLYIDEFNSRFPHQEDPALTASAMPPIGPARIGIVRPLLAIVAIVAAIAAVAAWQLRGSPQTKSSTNGGGSTAAPVTHPSATAVSTPATPPQRPAKRPVATPTSAVLAATKGRVWLQVRARDASGTVLFEGMLEQGRTLPVKLAPRVWLRVGAPWNLEIRLGGHVVAGMPAHVADLILDGGGLSPAP